MNDERSAAFGRGGEWSHEVREEREEEEAGEHPTVGLRWIGAALLMWFQMGRDRWVPLALPVLNPAKDAALAEPVAHTELAEPVAPSDIGNPLRLTADCSLLTADC